MIVRKGGAAMFANRGFMLDISRNKVPTMATLRTIVDILKTFGYNQFQLYTEHAFRYSRHEAVWRDASPMTPEEVRELDACCRINDVELVPNQNSFGHLENWLKLPAYNHLAAMPKGGAVTPWGTVKEFPTTLDPGKRESLDFLSGLYDELLPCFTSKLFNIGCDETFEIADPEVYLGFLLKVCDLAKARGMRPMVWGDIVLRHPELTARLPKDLLMLDWGYEGNHPFAEETRRFREAGLDFYVCPGTSSWNSLAGRVENMRENMAAAESAGRLNGASGYLVTDWGDFGHWQPLAASLPGIILGGWFAVHGAKAATMNLEEALDSVMGVPLGGTLLRLGTLYLRGGALRANASELFRILANDRGYSRHPNLTDPVLAEIASAAEGCRHAASAFVGDYYGPAAVWAREIVFMANMVDAACHRRDERRLSALREEHRRVWLLRNRPGGLEDSLSKLPRF